MAIVNQELIDGLGQACAKNGRGFASPDACHAQLNLVTDALANVFKTSDVDLRIIYNTMFSCPLDGGLPLVSILKDNVARSGELRKILNGDKNDPGLLKDLTTLVASLNQVQAIAEGQDRSLKISAASQVVGLRTLQSKVSDSAKTLLDQTTQIMESLVGNRTQAQTEEFVRIRSSVDTAIKDIANQAGNVDVVSEIDHTSLRARFAG
jgi:hypothetical protein